MMFFRSKTARLPDATGALAAASKRAARRNETLVAETVLRIRAEMLEAALRAAGRAEEAAAIDRFNTLVDLHLPDNLKSQAPHEVIAAAVDLSLNLRISALSGGEWPRPTSGEQQLLSVGLQGRETHTFSPSAGVESVAIRPDRQTVSIQSFFRELHGFLISGRRVDTAMSDRMAVRRRPTEAAVDPNKLLDDLRGRLRTGRRDEARELLDRLEAHLDDYPDFAKAMAVFASRLDQPDRAVAFFEIALMQAVSHCRPGPATAALIADVERGAPGAALNVLGTEAGLQLVDRFRRLLVHEESNAVPAAAPTRLRISAQPSAGAVRLAHSLGTPCDEDDLIAAAVVAATAEIFQRIHAPQMYLAVVARFPFAERIAGTRQAITAAIDHLERAPMEGVEVVLGADTALDPLLALIVPREGHRRLSGWFPDPARLGLGLHRAAGGDRGFVSLASVERARRSLELFVAGAHASPAGEGPFLLERDTTTLLPTLTASDGRNVGALATDRNDPATHWINATAGYVARRLCSSPDAATNWHRFAAAKLVAFLFLSEIPLWLRSAELCTAARRHGEVNLGSDLGWFERALMDAVTPSPARPWSNELLVVSASREGADRLGMAARAAGIATEAIVIHVLNSAGGIVRPSGLSESLDAMVRMARLVVTDVRTMAISAALRGHATVFVGDDEVERLRLPRLAGLTATGGDATVGDLPAAWAAADPALSRSAP